MSKKAILLGVLFFTVASVKSQQIVINDKLLSQITVNHGFRLGSEQTFLDSYEKQKELYDDVNNKITQIIAIQKYIYQQLKNVNSALTQSKKLKDGEDIRPLKPTGVQNQRFAQLKFQEEEAKKIKAASDTIHKRSVQDFAHWTSATVDADPLWLLYYKRMLKPITEFPDHPQNFIEWRLKDQQTFETLNTTGTIRRLKEELDLIKEKYSMSRSMDMPRGKRFIMYHETLIKWRKFVQELRNHNNKTTLLTDYKNILKNHSNYALPPAWTPASDQQIIHNTMQHYKHRY